MPDANDAAVVATLSTKYRRWYAEQIERVEHSLRQRHDAMDTLLDGVDTYDPLSAALIEAKGYVSHASQLVHSLKRLELNMDGDLITLTLDEVARIERQVSKAVAAMPLDTRLDLLS